MICNVRVLCKAIGGRVLFGRSYAMILLYNNMRTTLNKDFRTIKGSCSCLFLLLLLFLFCYCCFGLFHEPTSLLHHYSVLVDLSVSVMMHCRS